MPAWAPPKVRTRVQTQLCQHIRAAQPAAIAGHSASQQPGSCPEDLELADIEQDHASGLHHRRHRHHSGVDAAVARARPHADCYLYGLVSDRQHHRWQRCRGGELPDSPLQAVSRDRTSRQRQVTGLTPKPGLPRAR